MSYMCLPGLLLEFGLTASYSGPEVGLEEIAFDVSQARLRTETLAAVLRAFLHRRRCLDGPDVPFKFFIEFCENELLPSD